MRNGKECACRPRMPKMKQSVKKGRDLTRNKCRDMSHISDDGLGRGIIGVSSKVNSMDDGQCSALTSTFLAWIFDFIGRTRHGERLHVQRSRKAMWEQQ